MKRCTIFLFCFGILFLGARYAAGQCVVVINTGYDQDAEAVLAEGDVDEDWTVDDGLTGPVPTFTGGAANGFPIPPWFANDEDSLWISPAADSISAPATYTYEILVDLDDSVTDPENMMLLGSVAGDDGGVDIIINGVSTGVAFGGFGGFTDIPSGTGFGLFVDGENSIQFLVNNTAGDPVPENPAGLRVDACVAVGAAQSRRFDISTGFDQSTLKPIESNQPDDDYTISGPLGDGVAAISVDDSGFPIPPWALNTIQSRWIGTDQAQSSAPVGDYIFKIEVELPGDFSSADAVLLGGFTADDLVTDILVNSQSTGISGADFSQLNDFPLNAGRGLFVTGTNTIEFVVNNADEGPLGLRVDAEIGEGPPELEGNPSLLSLDTGFDNEAGQVIANSEPDDNYIIYGPAGSGISEPATVVPDNAFPIPPWIGTTELSKWIGTSDLSSNGPAGLYRFQIIVEVPDGMDASQLKLIGGWTADNGATDVLVNDVSTGVGVPGSFNVLTPIPEDTGLGLFQNGLNTVVFVVENATPDGNPVGLRVEAVVGTGIPDPADISTGVAPRGIGLLPDGGEDLRYVVTGPGGAGIGPRPAVAVPADGSPIPPWAANSDTSRWVGLDDSDSVGPAGTYFYDVSIDLPIEFNAFRTVLTGSWAAAGSGADVLVNGQSLGITASGPNSLTPFPEAAGEGFFVPGTNTIRFVVENASEGSTGLRVDARLGIIVRDNPLDFSTGFDQDAGVAIDPGMEDGDYVVTDPFDIEEQAVVVPDDPGIATWLPNTASSAWIGLTGAIAASPGSYRYQLEINLTAEEAETATVVGFWASDDGATDIIINGVSTGAVTTGGFMAPTYFPPDAGLGFFQEGLNIIEVLVDNGGVDPNPSGLRIDAFIATGAGPSKPEFVRGDANDDGTVNITDGIFILNFLFLGGPTPPCMEAANPNDDSSVNITDGIYVLNFLFLGGPAPLDPGSENCGPDPADSESQMSCDEFTSC